MGLRFCSFASGSTGNCYLLKTEKTNLLVDVGIAGKRIIGGLDSCAVKPEQIDGILVTHEHTDHIKSLRMMAKKAVNGKIYTSEGTAYSVNEKMPMLADKIRITDTAASFKVGDIEVETFSLSHDAEDPVGFSVNSGGKRVTIITDTGVATKQMLSIAAKSDLLVLEANHEVNILHCSSYPYELKRRILSDYGHLSNDAAAEFIYEVDKLRKNGGGENKSEKQKILLAHLSKENNSPMQAMLTIKNRLFEEDMIAGEDYLMNSLSADVATRLLEI